jgi:hypothetical protein
MVTLTTEFAILAKFTNASLLKPNRSVLGSLAGLWQPFCKIDPPNFLYHFFIFKWLYLLTELFKFVEETFVW